jgi:hypothetical protein
MEGIMTKETQMEQDGIFPPVFAPAPKATPKVDQATLSFFDIKGLYDRAYEALNAGRTDYKAKEMMAEAIKMDMMYRCQIARKNTYNKCSRLEDFRITSKSA